MATGFFRTTIATRHNKQYYKYQIRNRLVNKEIIAKDIMDLKNKVESYGFLWGIINKNEDEKHSGKYKLKELQGKYGIQIGD